MFLESEKDIIRNYVFNYLKLIEFNQIEHGQCKRILEKTKYKDEILRCLMMKNIEIYTDKLTCIFNKNFYNTFVFPYSLNRESDWNNVKSFWNSSLFSDNKEAYYLLIDIGNFKKINDEFSYKTGDTFLKAIGTFLIKENIGFNIRNGGDEFIVISNNKDKVKKIISKFSDLLFIKDINLNLLKLNLFQNRDREKKSFEKIKDKNCDKLVYVGAGMSKINLNKIRKYIETKNERAYRTYTTSIENKATINMKNFKKNIKDKIKISSYRT